MAQLAEPAAVRLASFGHVVKNSWTVAADSTTTDIFSIDGGPIVLTLFAGVVTTAIGANTDFDIVLDPDDGGSNIDIASTLAVDSDVTGSLYTLNATAGGALVADLDLGYNALLNGAIAALVVEGDIAVTVGGGGGGAGVVDWYLGYIPLDDETSVTAV